MTRRFTPALLLLAAACTTSTTAPPTASEQDGPEPPVELEGVVTVSLSDGSSTDLALDLARPLLGFCHNSMNYVLTINGNRHDVASDLAGEAANDPAPNDLAPNDPAPNDAEPNDAAAGNPAVLNRLYVEVYGLRTTLELSTGDGTYVADEQSCTTVQWTPAFQSASGGEELEFVCEAHEATSDRIANLAGDLKAFGCPVTD